MNERIFLRIATSCMAVAILFCAYFITQKNTELDGLTRKKKIDDMSLSQFKQKADSLVVANDSLTEENVFMYSQVQLTGAMNLRDSMSMYFPYAVGEMVMVKPDSAIAVVEDVVIGGDEFDFHMKAMVRFKDSHFEMLSPNLLIKLKK